MYSKKCCTFYLELDLVEMISSPPNHFGRKHASLYGADGCALGNWLAGVVPAVKNSRKDKVPIEAIEATRLPARNPSTQLPKGVRESAPAQ